MWPSLLLAVVVATAGVAVASSQTPEVFTLGDTEKYGHDDWSQSPLEFAAGNQVSWETESGFDRDTRRHAS